MAPVVRCIQRDSIALGFAVRQQLHLHAVRPCAILVVPVVPRLRDRHVHLAGCVAVRHGIAGFSRPGDLYAVLFAVERDLVVLFADFLHRVGDGLAVRLLRQVGPGIGPAVLFAQRDRVTLGRAIRQQPHLHALRTRAVLVVPVVPRLCHGNCRLGNMDVCDRSFVCGICQGSPVIICAVVCGISFDLVFSDRIHDRGSVLVCFRQIRKGDGIGTVPVVLCGQTVSIYICYICSVGKQLHLRLIVF